MWTYRREYFSSPWNYMDVASCVIIGMLFLLHITRLNHQVGLGVGGLGWGCMHGGGGGVWGWGWGCFGGGRCTSWCYGSDKQSRFLHPSIHPPTHPSTHPSIHPPIHAQAFVVLVALEVLLLCLRMLYFCMAYEHFGALLRMVLIVIKVGGWGEGCVDGWMNGWVNGWMDRALGFGWLGR